MIELTKFTTIIDIYKVPNSKDFISFRTEGNKERYGDNKHYIGMQQLLNCRNRNKREQIFGLENIDTLIDELNKSNLE